MADATVTDNQSLRWGSILFYGWYNNQTGWIHFELISVVGRTEVRLLPWKEAVVCLFLLLYSSQVWTVSPLRIIMSHCTKYRLLTFTNLLCFVVVLFHWELFCHSVCPQQDSQGSRCNVKIKKSPHYEWEPHSYQNRQNSVWIQISTKLQTDTPTTTQSQGRSLLLALSRHNLLTTYKVMTSPFDTCHFIFLLSLFTTLKDALSK